MSSEPVAAAVPLSGPPGNAAPAAPRTAERGSWLLTGVGLLVLPTLAVLGAVALEGTAGTAGGVGSVASALWSPLFLGVLGAELLAWALLRTRGRGVGERLVYVAPAALLWGSAAGTLVPPLGRVGFLGASAFLVVWFTVLLQYVYRHRQLGLLELAYVREVTAVAVGVTAGWLLWALDGSAALGAASAILAVFVLARGLRPTPAPPVRVAWIQRPDWAFQLLLFTFLAEFFVGALLDLEVTGRGFLQYIPFLPVAGSPLSLTELAVYDGLWFGAAILASAWFLVALGVTMGGLVVLRLREVHVPAQRYRMVLMLAVFALAAVYVPSLASSTPLVSNRVLASVPILGWGFGLRSGGPFEAGIFLAVLVMYASVGVLTVLFGRKALCSVMCGAALMYQGTAMHEMREFNQSSRVGRYFLGSRLSSAYMIASTLALGSLFAISLLAYLHRLPTVQVASGQYDTSALPLPIELYFGGLWFAMFVSTPYVGTYNCATTGVCHWGALSVPFTKVSFFRLRVKDREVCQRCTTFDCAKACPVGLVDMPLHFRTRGEYRSSKCCGVGDCVGACPYGNLYHQDVRNWIARAAARLSRRRVGTPLPMAAPAARTSSAPPAPERAAGGP